MNRLALILVGVLGGCTCKADPPRPSAAAGSGALPVRGADGTSGSAPFGIPAYTPGNDVPGPIAGAIADDDRTDADRKLDAGRRPGEVLAFFRIAPGQKVAELFAGGGYTTELVARAVGDSGKVWAHNTPELLERIARGPLTARLARLGQLGAGKVAPVIAVERPGDAPLPAEATGLDAVLCVLTYHDLVGARVDRAKLNAAVRAALRPGGVYGVVDHSAAAGTGARDAAALHRIEQALVVQEVTAAGFRLDGESAALRNPADPRDWNASPGAAAERRGTSDRFVLRFVRP